MSLFYFISNYIKQTESVVHCFLTPFDYTSIQCVLDANNLAMCVEMTIASYAILVVYACEDNCLICTHSIF